MEQTAQYRQRNPRINKPDMFMCAALWMERSPLAENPLYNFVQPIRHEEQDGCETKSQSKQGKPVCTESMQPNQKMPRKLNKCGAVYVLPNDRALSVDCSQGGVHAAVSGLVKFGHERVKGCQVYLSRRPCAFCAKLLVQCEVSKVYFLPIEPELNDPENIKCVDNIFKSSSTGLQIFTPRVRDCVIDDIKNNQVSPFSPRNETEIQDMKRQLENEYWSDEWISMARDVLKWPAFFDNMKEQTMKDMKNLMEWLARVTFGDIPKRLKFAEIDPETRQAKENRATGEETEGSSEEGQVGSMPTWRKLGIPTPTVESWQHHAKHMCRMARMLSQRSDDPSRRVGCVLMAHNEVVALGWNGFPAKSQQGEFPRASCTDQVMDHKEQYVIHAEENALLTRTKRNLKNNSSILFISKIPAPECIPMLLAAGVRHIVVPKEPSTDPENTAFFDVLVSSDQERGITGYWPTEQHNSATRDLDF